VEPAQPRRAGERVERADFPAAGAGLVVVASGAFGLAV
jgi:hypothetical protein